MNNYWVTPYKIYLFCVSGKEKSALANATKKYIKYIKLKQIIKKIRKFALEVEQ
jgi:cellobiose-specific phosphotransferase system component IIB